MLDWLICPIFYFYPRPPRGGRRFPGFRRRNHRQFLSTPSARRATAIARDALALAIISIHALREEGDVVDVANDVLALLFLSTPSARRATRVSTPRIPRTTNFYPRPPRGGRPPVLAVSLSL